MGFFALFSQILCLQSPLMERKTMFLSVNGKITMKWLCHSCRYDVFVVSGEPWCWNCTRKRPDFFILRGEVFG